MKLKRSKDPEGEILALGWDTESTGANRMRAIRGASSTPWFESWEAVLDYLKSQNP